MTENGYIRTIVTMNFLRRVLKPYTQKARIIEAKKNGVRKERVTKKTVCNNIIKDMERAGLI